MKRLIFFLGALLLAGPQIALADVQVAAGVTSQCFDVKVLDTTATTPTNAGKTGLAFGSATLTCTYHRDTAPSATAITMASSTLGTYTSGAWKEVSSSLQPGVYQFCPPNAALATGANTVSFTCTGVSGMSQMDLRVTLLQPNTFGYDGQLASKSTTDLGLATGQIDANNQYAFQNEVVFFDAAGLVEANSCIIASVAATEHVTTAEDISALITVGDNYIVRPNSACRGLRPVTAGNPANVDGSGNITVGDIVAGALSKFFLTDSGSTYASSVAGSVVKEIATNSGTNASIHFGTAQSVGSNTIRLAAAETFGDNVMNNNWIIVITGSTGTPTAVGGIGCVKSNVSSNDTVTMLRPWSILPSGTVTYAAVPQANCNLALYPSGH